MLDWQGKKKRTHIVVSIEDDQKSAGGRRKEDEALFRKGIREEKPPALALVPHQILCGLVYDGVGRKPSIKSKE